MTKFRLASVAVLVCIVEGAAAQSKPAIVTILQSELSRNVSVLKQQPVPAYYTAYTLHDSRSTQILASFGAIDRSDESRQRFATVEVRVGDYQLDNTHPIRGDVRALSPRLIQVSLPLTDDEKPIRLALWRATDRSYKQATEALTRVRTNVAAKVQDANPAPDFSREDEEEHVEGAASYSLNTQAWETRLRRVSAVFSEDPLVLRSQVSLSVEADNRYYVNSEGSQIVTGKVSSRIFIQGVTKADDGMELPLYTSYFATSPDGLPDERRLVNEARAMVDLLARLRKAPLVEPFSGPAILSGRAAGVFFHEIFGHRVEANRQRNADDGQTFTSRVGQPVLPSFLSVSFDPTIKKVGDVELMGHYVYDDQGVKGQRVTVVDKGVLKTFLLDRAPLKNFPKSNGHGRAEPGFLPVSRQSNLQVESSKTVSRDQLMNQLREEARRQGKPFGLLFDNIEGGFTTTGRGSPNAFNVLPNVVYRIYTDGREPELVRGVDLIGTPLAAFGKIIATDDRIDVFNGVCGAESGGVPVSASSPSLLVSEVEVQKKMQSQETRPILPAPPASGRRS
ncbi:MAG TPA: metallopeptidase TldD-related protein [Vicinamibacterales bacterium]|nr:metallopeptidase TldD-related protein [Vicinamibacterales bacterium]